VIFLAEFITKFAYMRCDFFQTMWNSFDFALVILGILGLVMSILSVGQKSGSSGSESRVIRISRILRTMRFLRLFRLFHASLGKDPLISEELASAMKHMSILNNFVVAHVSAQKSMLKYFAGDTGVSKEVELGRCLLQSQISVFQATAELNDILLGMEPELVVELQNTRFRKGVIEKLEDHIGDALQKGAITSKNAAALLHPLHHELSGCIQRVTALREGRNNQEAPFGGHGHEHGHEDDSTNFHPFWAGGNKDDKDQKRSGKKLFIVEQKQDVAGLLGVAAEDPFLSSVVQCDPAAPKDLYIAGIAGRDTETEAPVTSMESLRRPHSGDRAAGGINVAVLAQEDFSTGHPPPAAAAITYGNTAGPQPSRSLDAPGAAQSVILSVKEPDCETFLPKPTLELEDDTAKKLVKKKKKMTKRANRN